MPEHAARIACIISIIENFSATEISVENMDGGIKLIRFYCSEALRLFESAQVDYKLMEAQKLLDWLHSRRNEPLISLPDIYQNGPNSIRDKKKATQLVNILVEHGWLKSVEGSAEINGSNRKKAWLIVPKKK